MNLTVRAYNVLFGDCLLLSWDERDGEHHAWIDFGNFHNDKNAVFHIVYRDVLERTGGKLDLLVITHRHLDHLEGFYSLREKFADDFTIKRLWHAHVSPGFDDRFSVAGETLRGLLPLATRDGEGEIGRIFLNNFGTPSLTTHQRMDRILSTLRYDQEFAVHRESRMKDIMPPGVKRLKIQILAPEPDSAAYFESVEHALHARALLDRHFAGRRRGSIPRGLAPADPFGFKGRLPAAESPLIQLADFARLRRQLRTGGLDLLAAADKTRNNTSIVMKVTYGRRRLLFTGDAEEKSWELIRRRGYRLSANLVKVGHHGSINATPEWTYRKIMPRRYKTNAVLLSTEPTRFTGKNEVPKSEVVDGWRDRLHGTRRDERFKRTDDVALGSFQEFTF